MGARIERNLNAKHGFREHPLLTASGSAGLWRVVAACLGLVVGPAVAGAATHYVAPTGSDSLPCSSGAPCQHIDFAVKNAGNGDTILVAGGTYTYANVGNTGCDTITSTAGRNVVCHVGKGLTIEGGYTAGTWVLNPAANPTVIDGQGTRRAYFLVGPSASLTMRNFTLRNGVAQVHTGDNDVFGGGMLADLASLVLEDVRFESNTAPGRSLTGAGGAAAGSGLGMRTAPGSSSLTRVVFQGNSSTGGQGTTRGGFAFGALFVFQSTLAIADSAFYSNSAQGGSSTGTGDASGARGDGLGGAIGIELNSTVTLTDATVTDNSATGGAGTQFGGGAFGGGVFVENAILNVVRSRFQANVATGASATNGGLGAGGGLLYFNSNGSIDGARFLRNTAIGGASAGGQFAGVGNGGGLYLWYNNVGHTQSPYPVKNSIFAGNQTSNGATGTNAGGGGGGLFVQGVTANVEHATFDDNRIGSGAVPQFVGQAIAVIEAPAVSTTTLNLSYSVVSNHRAAVTNQTTIVVNATNTVSFTNGRFSGNTRNTNIDNTPLPAGTINGLGNMLAIVDPGYVNPSGGDYHLRPGSALIDGATGSSASSDVDGLARDARPDIGADEAGTRPLFLAELGPGWTSPGMLWAGAPLVEAGPGSW